jgi:hypothetical protein
MCFDLLRSSVIVTVQPKEQPLAGSENDCTMIRMPGPEDWFRKVPVWISVYYRNFAEGFTHIEILFHLQFRGQVVQVGNDLLLYIWFSCKGETRQRSVQNRWSPTRQDLPRDGVEGFHSFRQRFRYQAEEEDLRIPVAREIWLASHCVDIVTIAECNEGDVGGFAESQLLSKGRIESWRWYQ